MTGRSEDELRAAFAAKSDEAPRSDDVLRAVRRQVNARPRGRRGWLVPAVGAAAVVTGVGLGIALSNGSGDSQKKVGSADHGQAAGGGTATGTVTGPLSGTEPKAASQPSASRRVPGAAGDGGLCRPSDVTVTVRRDVAGATLTVTSHGATCQLDRVPHLQWDGAGQTYDAQPPTDSAGKAAPTLPPGVLSAGATATATVQWAGPCGEPIDDVVRVDWGAGPVEVHAAGAAPLSCASTPVAPPRVGGFTGLS